MDKEGLSRKLISSEVYENDSRDYPTIMNVREAEHLVTTIAYETLGLI
jgi:hypothetical protein